MINNKIIRIIALILCLAPSTNYAQEASQKPIIPTENGKVIFTSTYVTPLGKQEIHDRLSTWLSSDPSTIINSDDTTGMLISRSLEYLEIEKKDWSIFSMYMRYTLVLEYKDQFCKASIRQIQYYEPEDIEKKVYNSNTTSYSAEFILIEKKYKLAFVKNAADKIAEHTVRRINEIFSTVPLPKKEETRNN